MAQVSAAAGHCKVESLALIEVARPNATKLHPPFSGLAPPCKLLRISSSSRRGTFATGSSVRIEAPRSR